MKHKQYERWILDEIVLDNQQQKELESHLLTCKSCQALQAGWNATRLLISNATAHTPQPGFANRWQMTIARKCQIEKVRRYRISMFMLVVAAFLGAITYALFTGSIMQSIANGITILSDLFVRLTSGFSTLGYWVNRLPIFVPISLGFLLFGLFTAFVMAGMFFLWNLRQRKLQPNEIKID